MRGTFELVYGHNFYDMGSPAGWPCTVKQVDGEWTYCGGYQSWMDFYIEDAHHLIMVASPLSRMASMYYYEAGYTKQRDRGPEDEGYKRISEEEVTPTRGTRQPYVTYEAESQSCKGTVRLNSLHHSNSNSRAFFVNGDFVFGADQRTKARMY